MPVEPMYMPGRRRTASRPSRTVMSCAPYSVSANRRPYLGLRVACHLDRLSWPAGRLPWHGSKVPGVRPPEPASLRGIRQIAGPHERTFQRRLDRGLATDRPQPVPKGARRPPRRPAAGAARRAAQPACGTGPTRNRSCGAGPASAAASFSRSSSDSICSSLAHSDDVTCTTSVPSCAIRAGHASRATGAPTASGQTRRIGSSDSAPDDGGSIAPSRSPTRFTPAG